jgi:hypothetical protein
VSFGCHDPLLLLCQRLEHPSQGLSYPPLESRLAQAIGRSAPDPVAHRSSAYEQIGGTIMPSLFDLTYYGLVVVILGLLGATTIAGVVVRGRLAGHAAPSHTTVSGR